MLFAPFVLEELTGRGSFLRVSSQASLNKVDCQVSHIIWHLAEVRRSVIYNCINHALVWFSAVNGCKHLLFRPGVKRVSTREKHENNDAERPNIYLCVMRATLFTTLQELRCHEKARSDLRFADLCVGFTLFGTHKASQLCQKTTLLSAY